VTGWHRSGFSGRWRDYYNDVLFVPAWLNMWRWRAQLRLFGVRRPAPVLVNLGSGKDYRSNYINVDINIAFKRDMWLDLRNRLPFPDAIVDGIFCAHTFEHFSYEQALRLTCECHRVLRPGGVLRAGVPDFVPAIEAYQTGNLAWLRSPGRSAGRRFSDHVLDQANHKLLFDYGYLEEMLQNAGFSDVRHAGYRKGAWPVSQQMAELDNRPEITVFAEARA
jgi:predicted SAM-dependent methyltransferase